ncbi:Uncharacterised protein [Yersinia intermedia]|uniref:Uncharacterized protein n=1 Tax=Yersinia intermedia TaxID=631 RepID=A0A0T9MT31_YERIN|nr:Uncharacterised protein [Yersinia intermedia]
MLPIQFQLLVSTIIVLFSSVVLVPLETMQALSYIKGKAQYLTIYILNEIMKGVGQQIFISALLQLGM